MGANKSALWLLVLLSAAECFLASNLPEEDRFYIDKSSENSGVYKQCGKTRVCFGVPANCIESKNCTYLLSYGKAHHGRGDEKKNLVQVVLYGTTLNKTYTGGFWSGFAVTTTASMDMAAVIQCVRYSNGKGEVVAGFNGKDHSYETLKARHLGIHHPRHRFHNGYQLCAFDLDVDRKVNDTLFNLSTPYNILLADGWVNETSPGKYDLKWHLEKPTITDKTVIACGVNCSHDSHLTSSSSIGSDPIVYRECNKTRACVGAPANCVQSKNCTYLLSYGKERKDVVHMTLYGTTLNASYTGGFWSGFGVTETGTMDQAAVIQCAHYGNGSAEIVAAFNSFNHTYNTLTERHLGIRHPRYHFHDGYQSCSFQLEVQRVVNGTKFDLNNSYNILLADGWVNATSANTYDLKWHLEKPTVTDKTVIACGAGCKSE